MDTIPLLMIGAMYENGGNTVHRLLDGHPNLFVYPFESQLGTRLTADHLTSVFPAKYRWPVFRLGATNEENYHAIIDEECRVRVSTPQVSKFRFELSERDRYSHFLDITQGGTQTRPRYVTAFLRATMLAWHDSCQTREPTALVGYSPIITVDSLSILSEMAQAHFIHVVRNPWSAYADTKHRPAPLPVAHYLHAWATVQLAALQVSRIHPDRFHLIRFEDVVADPLATLGAVCVRLGLPSASSLASPSWNGSPLSEVYPWGTIRIPTTAQNRATAAELSREELATVRDYVAPLLQLLDYDDFLDS